MITALPSFAATPEAHLLGRAHRPGGGTSQAVLFSTTILCSHLRRLSSTIAGLLAVARPWEGLENRSGAAILKPVEWKHHCGSGGTGRRARLRILWPKGRGGSNPSFRTNFSVPNSSIVLDSRVGRGHNTLF